MTIWKFQLHNSSTELLMPIGAKILSAQYQKGVVCIWALVDTSKENESRYFNLLCTGEDVFSDIGTFIGTCVSADNYLVLHVFENI